MRLSSVLIAGAAAFAFAAMTQSAGADSISTGVAGVNWKLKSIQPLGNPSSIPGASNVGLDALHSAQIINPANAGWGASALIEAYEAGNSLSPPAKWIGATTNGGQEGVWGWYTFELTLTPSTAGTYYITGALSADNMVDSFMINGVEQLNPGQTVPGATPSAIYGFNFTYEFQANANSPITLTARVYNESDHRPQGDAYANYPLGPSGVDDMNNPLGFILAGEANFTANGESVPTPAAAFGGFTLLGGLAATRLRRRS